MPEGSDIANLPDMKIFATCRYFNIDTGELTSCVFIRQYLVSSEPLSDDNIDREALLYYMKDQSDPSQRLRDEVFSPFVLVCVRHYCKQDVSIVSCPHTSLDKYTLLASVLRVPPSVYWKT